MSVNTAHANEGVLLHSGEYILLYVSKAIMEFFGQADLLFERQKPGRIYLTSHRLIFISRLQCEPMQSFSAPYVAISEFKKVSDTNRGSTISARVHAQPNGNFTGSVVWKLWRIQGIDEFAKAMVTAGSLALQNLTCSSIDEPPKLPPYAPTRAWFDAPLAAYQLPKGYFGWLPKTSAFPDPPPNSVFLCDNPAPFPGISKPSIKHIRRTPCEPFGRLDGAGDGDPPPNLFGNLGNNCHLLSFDDCKFQSHNHEHKSQQDQLAGKTAVQVPSLEYMLPMKTAMLSSPTIRDSFRPLGPKNGVLHRGDNSTERKLRTTKESPKLVSDSNFGERSIPDYLFALL